MGKHGDGYLYQKRGAGCWRVRWTVQGKEHDESTGTTDYEIAKKIAKQKFLKCQLKIWIYLLEALTA